MRKAALLSLVVLAAACGAEEAAPGRPPIVETDGATPAQLAAFAQLEASTNQSWTWVQHRELKTPMHLSAPRTGAPVLRDRKSAVQVTIDLLDRNRALFRMHDPAAELRSTRAEIDDLGMTHARFQQVVHGVPVAGAELMAHYDGAGRLTSLDASYVPDLDGLDVHPTLSAAEALAAGKAYVAARDGVDAAVLAASDARLVVYAANEHIANPRLAYQYQVDAMAAHPPALWNVTVDAKSGEVLHRYDNLQTVQAQGSGVLGDKKQFEVSQASGGFVMTDATGVRIRTLTAEQQQIVGTDVTSTDANTWDVGVVGQGAAVDAHFFATAVADYFQTVHGRNAIDGAGGALVSTVHFGEAFENAAWTGKGMIYGDGGEVFRPLSVGLDVVGHEFTHGVTEKTSNLTYENQPGALNEAVSDIFGAFIEHKIKPDAVKNWQIGEAVTLSNSALRDMSSPGNPLLGPQPSNMSRFVNTSEDNGGVHINSGIINNAAFLMTVGGVNPTSRVEVKYGIGWEKSEKLWFRANTKYFMSSTNFGQAAQAVLQAAQDVGLTRNEINIVDCAFKATGVAQGDCATLLDPASASAADTNTASSTDEGSDDTEESTPAPKRRRLVTTTTSSGCNASGSGADPGALFGVLAALAALGAKRRGISRTRP